MRLLVVEPHVGGHQAGYARHLVEAWAARGAPGALVVAGQGPLLDALADALAAAGARPALIRPDEVAPPQTGLANALGRGRLAPVRRLVEAHRPDHVLAMSFEQFAGPLARRARLPGRTPLSALAFHTGADRPPTLRAALRDLALGAALRHPDLRTLYTVDPSAPPRIRALGTRADVVAVPDPIPPPQPVPPAAEVQAAYGVEPGRRLAVLLGTLDGRKGAAVLLEALRHLPAEVAARLAVVLAGRVEASAAAAVADGVARAEAETAVQVVHRPGFVSDAALAALTAAADLALLPYRGQVGSSGFLMRAAAAGTPVLTQADGLMGWLTRTHGLGQAVDTADPAAVAAALARAVADPAVGFRAEGAAALAAAATPEAFADALLTPLFGPR